MFGRCGRYLVVALALVLVTAWPAMTTQQLPAAVDRWLREHRIGPYQEERVEYDALYEAAKEEGKVVVYASSSRGPQSVALGFSRMYPEIRVEWHTLGTSDAIERVIREQQAGIYNVDILFVSDFPTQVTVLHGANMLFPWTPPELRRVIPSQFQNPLLAHRYEARVVFYNDDAYRGRPPIESWWDLTRKPTWHRNIVMVDPRTDGSTLNLLTTFVRNADEMAAEYRRVFGRPLRLTTPNAGYEFIKLLAANQPRLIRRDSDGRFIGKRGQQNPPVGVSFAFSRIRDSGDPEHGNISWTVATDLRPRVGLLYPSGVNIVHRAPHPNAAKLLIRWLMGDEKGGAGMTPWMVPGNWPARTDVTVGAPHPFETGKAWAVGKLNWWYEDARGIWREKQNVLEFVQAYFR